MQKFSHLGPLCEYFQIMALNDEHQLKKAEYDGLYLLVCQVISKLFCVSEAKGPVAMSSEGLPMAYRCAEVKATRGCVWGLMWGAMSVAYPAL